MIGLIASDHDISVYLESAEVDRILREQVEGVLVKFHRPKQQGEIAVSVNDNRSNENGCGIGVFQRGYSSDSPGRVELFISALNYDRLLETGSIGQRYGFAGSNVHLFDCSRLDRMGAMVLEDLEFYRDNREKLVPELG